MPLTPEAIPQMMTGFGSDPKVLEIFFPGDTPCPSAARARFDISLGDGTRPNKVELFQEDPVEFDRFFEVDIWYDGIAGLDAGGRRRDLADFILGGWNCWTAMSAGDPVAARVGIFPLKDEPGAACEHALRRYCPAAAARCIIISCTACMPRAAMSLTSPAWVCKAATTSRSVEVWVTHAPTSVTSISVLIVSPR